MNSWQKIFSRENIFYITPDVKRGIGLEDVLPNFYIVCSFFEPLIPILRKQGAKIFCLEEVRQNGNVFNSGKLLEHPKVEEYIKKNAKGGKIKILAFKPSLKLEDVARKKGYHLLINSFSLNEKFEDKIKFFSFLKKNFPQYLIPSEIGYLPKMNFSSLARKFCIPLVIQFSHGWAGKTTFFIYDSLQFKALTQKFPCTLVKVSKFIKGFTVLNNACIYKKKVLVSPSAWQISNIKELNIKPAVTCGRQWPASFLSKKQEEEIKEITEKIGKVMEKEGFLGFFGLDFLVEEKSQKVFLSENNARFTASSPFYTKMELGFDRIPLLAYHLAAFLGKDIDQDEETNFTLRASQIIFRHPKIQPKIDEKIDFAVIRQVSSRFNLRSNEYYPQKLSPGEFIFIRNKNIRKRKEVEEYSRIESKDEVLDAQGNLRQWVKELIS